MILTGNKFISENLKISISQINSRALNENGKIEVSEREWDYLWKEILGYPNKTIVEGAEETSKWLEKASEFERKYIIKN